MEVTLLIKCFYLRLTLILIADVPSSEPALGEPPTEPWEPGEPGELAEPATGSPLGDSGVLILKRRQDLQTNLTKYEGSSNRGK